MNPLQKQKLNGLLLGSSCLVASVLLGLSPALAGSAAGGLPSGGNVVSGNAKIGGHGSKITQTSEKAFIDWNNFSIGAGETVTIKGPNKNAVTVNRVTGVDRSVIDGVLRANDNVWLLNGNGILFGKGSIINVGSLIATTSDLSDDDFRKGKYRFTTGSNPNASVINKGKITAADGGTVILSAAHVANEGVVKANLGTVVLGGANAFTVDLNGDNLIRYQVTAQVTQAPTDSKGNAQKALVSNSGKIQADGGTVLMTSRAASNVQDNVINNSGMIEATSVSSHNGEVDLDAGTLDTRADGYRKSAGTVDDSGQIDVCGTAKGETGGTVTMTGRNVVVADGARIDAQGYAGGGTVLIGGDFHGHGSLKQAKNVTIGKATINADATHKGDGGKIAIWSRGDTSFDGTVRARGGREGGNGGFVETSGHLLSIDSASVTTLAARGNAGTWLIDPYAVEICSSGCSSNGSTTAITTASIQSALAGGGVTIEADGGGANSTINWGSNATLDYSSANALSLLAQGSIIFESGVQNSSTGDINLVAGWNGSTGITGNVTNGQSNGTSVNMSAILSNANAYGNNKGTVTIGYTGASSNGPISVGSHGGTTTVAADNLNVGLVGNSTANMQLGYAGSGGGNIDVFLKGNLTVQSDQDGYSQIGNGDASRSTTVTSATGNITLEVAGSSTLGSDGGRTAWIGNVASNGDTETGDVTWLTNALTVNSCGSAPLGDMVASDLIGAVTTGNAGASGTGGGNVTLAITGSCGTIDWGSYFSDGLDYGSGNAFSLLNAGAMALDTSIQNIGSGNINLVAGWDGSTGLSTSGIDVATILTSSDFGASGGDITLGDANSGESVAVGSAGGTTTVAAANLFVGPPNGCQTANFQLGYLGNGGGDIDIVLTGDLDIQSDQGGTSRVGNGGASYTGAVTGNITINAANINMNQNNAYGSGEAVIGNYGAGAVGGIIGITTSGDVLMSSKNGGGTQVSIGNDSYGDVSTTGNVTLNIGGNLSMYATGYATGNGGHDGGTYIGSKSATSNIKVTVAQNITMTVVPLHSYVTHNYVQIGNFGSSASDSQAGGNITVTSTHGNIVMRERSYGGVQIGNTYAHTVSGNIVVTASEGDIDMSSNHGTTQIGNSAYGGAQVSGNVTVKATQGNIGLYSLGQNALVEIGNGPSVQTSGDITVTAGGAINLQAEYKYATARIGNNGSGGTTSGNIKVTAGGSISLYSNGEFGAGVVAQIGNGGGNMQGKASGNIVVSGGSLSIGSNSVTAYAMIGNGDPLHESKYSNGTGGAYGNISVTMTGATTLNDYGGTTAWIGNLADGGSTEVGAVTLVTNSLGVNNNGITDSTTLGNMVASDLTGLVTTATSTQGGTGGGNVTIAITRDGVTTDWGTYFGDGLDVSNGNTLSLVTKASMAITTSIQNSEGGNIDLIAGWDGTTGLSASGFNAATVIANGAYGAGGGDVLIGGNGASGNVSVGSEGGATTITADNVTLDAVNGYAQIGYNGNGGGNITIEASGALTLIGGSRSSLTAQIGNGSAFDSVSAVGAVTILAGSLGTSGDADVAGTSADIAITGKGNIGSVSDPLEVAVSGLAIQTGGGSAYLTSLQGLSIGVGSDGIDLDGGDLVLSSDGAVTQTQAITASSIDISGASIALTNAGNSFGDATLSSSGNAKLYDASNLTIDSADVGGALTLSGGGNIGQSGAITANALNVTAGNGAITLTNIANSFGDATLAASGNASLYDAADLTVDGADVGGTLTLTGGGNIGQSGAITASVLNVTAYHGSITLTNTGNSFGDATLSASGNASLYDASNLTVDDATIGGNLTLSGGGNIDFVASIQNAGNGDITIGSGGTVIIGGANATGNVSVGSEGGATTITADNVTLDAVNGYAQIGYNGNGGGNITIEASGALTLIGGSRSSLTAQIGNGFVQSNGTTASGDISITAGNITLATGSSGEFTVIGNFAASESGNVTIDATSLTGDLGTSLGNDLEGGNFTLALSGNQTMTVSTGREYSSNYTLSITNGGDIVFDASLQNSGSGAIAFTSTGGDVLIGGNGASGNVSVGSEGGATTITADNVTLDAVNGYAQIGYNGNGGGNITIEASGALTLIGGGRSSLTAQIGNGFVQSNGTTASGDISITAGNITLATGSSGEFTVIGNFAASESGNVTIDATSLTGDLGTSLGNDLEGGNFTLALSGNQTMTVSTGREYSSNYTLSITNGGDIVFDASLQNSGSGAIAFTSTGGDVLIGGNGASGNVSVGSEGGATTITADNVTLDAVNGYAQIGYNGNGGGNITIEASGALTLIGGSRSSLTAQIGNGFVQSNGTTASGDISITAGNITLATGSSGEFTVIGNFAASESGNVTIDATSLTGDLGTSLGNDLEGGNFTLALSGNQTMTVSTGREYSSNYTLSITNGGDIVFDASLQNSGSGAIAFTSTGGDVLIGGNGASGNVSVGSEGGATTITADNVTLDAVNGYAQIGYNGNGGGNITIEASGALTLIGGSRSSLTAQIGNGSAFDSVSAVGAVTILAGSLGASGDADVAGTSADIAITGKGNIGSVSDPLEVAVSGLAIQTGGGSAYLTSLQGLSIGVGSDGIDLDGGDLVLSSDGAVTQTQAITASSIDISGASIALTNAGNSFGDATLSSSGNAKLYDASNLTIDSADVGGALTLSGGGNIGQSGAITANALNVTAGNGAITLTNIANSFGDATLAASGNASLYDAADLTVDGADVGGTLTLTGAKSIGQSGAIVASTLDVVANHGVIALTNTGNSIGDADLTSSGNASLYDASALTITGADVGGTLTLTGGGNIGQSGAIDAGTLSVTAKHGSIALTDADNDVTTASLSAHGDVALYDSVDLTVKSADAGGNLTLLTQGNLTFVSSVQLQNGDLLAVAGWDGTTTNPSDLATRGAYGNNGGSITVGGKNAAGDVAIGSANGSTTLAAANVTLDGENGYAQIGYHGAGSGDIDVVASRDVTLTGGAGAGDYAQIGNGGMGTSGDESGNITVDAVGAVALEGGDGKDAYAQIGHGGADADKNSHGYTNSGTIDVKGQTVALLAGAGDESYAQIGHGGFDLGDGLTGQGVNSGNITITAVDGVSLTGNGTDAYTQIGNGGDQVNANAGSSAGGSNSGDIVVAAGAGISMIAGASEDAYAQIGNGGFGTNASGDADPSNFTDSGTITVSDLVLTGSDTGKDAYAQIGNGDASGTGIGDVSGNITIDAGSITVHSGSAAGANAAIGNATGKGTVSGTVAGYTAPSSTTTTDPSTQGVVTSIVSQTSQANAQQVSLVVINPPENQQTSVISDTGTSDETGPLGQLSGDKEGSGNQASDDATDALGQSLGGHRHNIQTVALIPGVLTEVVNTQTVHGIPPADQNFSSWGNEALWRW